MSIIFYRLDGFIYLFLSSFSIKMHGIDDLYSYFREYQYPLDLLERMD